MKNARFSIQGLMENIFRTGIVVVFAENDSMEYTQPDSPRLHPDPDAVLLKIDPELNI